mmetsp:Transcript_67628/g.220143  ORF Transcript_67628/g.220143 Transcript_67628/m.220143 type:complete len:231 (+) Transcript_67628:597-1289(+)
MRGCLDDVLGEFRLGRGSCDGEPAQLLETVEAAPLAHRLAPRRGAAAAALLLGQEVALERAGEPGVAQGLRRAQPRVRGDLQHAADELADVLGEGLPILVLHVEAAECDEPHDLRLERLGAPRLRLQRGMEGVASDGQAVQDHPCTPHVAPSDGLPPRGPIGACGRCSKHLVPMPVPGVLPGGGGGCDDGATQVPKATAHRHRAAGGGEGGGVVVDAARGELGLLCGVRI